ncbi:MAG TPA: SDR family NAD(P)-dependent oxidoreductase [Ktedonobacterales bacterium]
MTALFGRTVLITGAAGGFGQCLVRQLLVAGSQVVLADLDREELSARTTATLERAGLASRAGAVAGYLAADLATPAGADALRDQCVAVAPTIDILINNAGMAMSGTFLATPRDRWETLLQVNLLAPLRLVALFAPAMVARGSGHIVNISSVAGLVGTPGLAAYSTAKFGLRGFTEALAEELHPRGVKVTGVYPFFARTPILRSPHYGDGAPPRLPARLVSGPDEVIAATLRGIERDAVHVYPTSVARVIDVLRRVAPGLLGRVVVG